MVNNPTRDEFSEITNSSDTYEWIADRLFLEGSVLVGWTDELGSHFDILFTSFPTTFVTNTMTFQGGIKSSDLYISIMRIGAFSFDVLNENFDTHPSYYAEKLKMDDGPTTRKLADLINGVRKSLHTRLKLPIDNATQS